MGRPRLYATQAQRQAAYRERLSKDQDRVLVDRRAILRLEERVERLRSAVAAAAHRGNAIAYRCCAASADTCLEKLAVWFETQEPISKERQARKR